MYHKNDPQTIQSMFTSIARNYDRTNAILSFQLHRWWNFQLVKKTLFAHQPEAFLDLCCGTGEIGFKYLKKAPRASEAYFLDFSEGMLACAKDKAAKLSFGKRHLIQYLQADAQQIPLPNCFLNCATIAYGIRNVQDPGKCIAEVYRVLKPGGIFGILELTEPKNAILRFGHQLYLKTFVPLLGRCFASNEQAYQYLRRSIHSFIKPMELKELLLNAGFEEVTVMPLSLGVATILVAKKPST